MTDTVRIGLIGDFNPDVKAHIAIPQALSTRSLLLFCELCTRQSTASKPPEFTPHKSTLHLTNTGNVPYTRGVRNSHISCERS